MSSLNTAPVATLTITNAVGGAGGSTTAGAAVEGLGSYESVALLATLTGVAGGALDLYVQTRHGAVWYDYAHFPQIAIGAAATLYRVTCSRFGVTAAPIVIGSGLTPALAVNTLVNGDFGDAMRLVVVAAAGAAAGTQTVLVAGTYPVAR